MNMPELYDYQKEAVAHAMEHNPDMIVIPTGEGKSITALRIADMVSTTTLIVVPTIELVKQWEKTIKKYGGECTTYSSGSAKEFSDFTVITYASMLLHMDMLQNYELIIFDEVHHLFAEEYVKMGKKAIEQGSIVIGLTASPRTMGSEEIIQNRMFPHRYERTISQRQRSDRAVDLRFYPEPVSFSDEEMKRYTKLWDTYVDAIRKHGGFREMMAYGGYNNSGASAYAQIKRMLTENTMKLRKAAEIIKSHPERKFIVFTDTIKMVNNLHIFLKKQGIESVVIHSPKEGYGGQSRKERERIIKDLEDGNARILIGCNAIEEGLDLPEMDSAIFLSNFSSSSRKVIQRAGRTMRLLPGKEVHIYVIYFEDTKEEENLEGIKRILGVN